MDDHKIRTVLAVLILLCLTAGGLWPVAAQQAGPEGNDAVSSSEYKAGELLVRFKEGEATLSAERILQQYDATYVSTLYGIEVEVWQVPVGSELETAEQLDADPRVEYAEPNYRVYAHAKVPNDPSFNRQWAHAIIQSPAAWDITTGSAAVTIAILDSGIDPAHPDLASKIVAGYDFVDGDTTPRDLNGHGTHVAGIAAAATNNGVGVAGMDWNARIMPVRVLEEDGLGYVGDLVSGIGWAYRNGAKVLNVSLSVVESSRAVQDAINNAHTAGSLVVAAMGGNGDDTVVYPAANDNVLAVAATGPTDTRAPYSNYGPHCDVAAPGGAMQTLHDPNGIYSTMPTYDVFMTTEQGYSGDYDYVHGTSQAAPYVSGLAALLWALKPSLRPDEVESYIKTTAVDLGNPGPDDYYGYGRIDVLAAMGAIPPDTPVLEPISNPDGDGKYVVGWNEVPNTTSYRLEEAEDPSFLPLSRSYSLTTNRVQVDGRRGGTWYYRVMASNAAGISPWSNVQWVTVRPDAPTLDPIENYSQDDEYQVTWKPADGASGYTLEEDDDVSFSSPVIRYHGTALQYRVTGQSNGTWYYRARGYNTAGDGDWSDPPQSTTVDVASLVKPDLESIDNEDQDGEFDVRWTGVTDAISYCLEESHDPYFSAWTVEYSGTATATLVVDQPGGTWYYRVRAFGADARSPWSNSQSVFVKPWVYIPLVVKDDH